jgi:predicted ATPase
VAAERRNRRKKVFLVALTGGPCAGKTTCLENLKKAVMKEGYNAMDVPEVPTILSNGGAKYPGPDAGEKLIAFEANLLKLQVSRG